MNSGSHLMIVMRKLTPYFPSLALPNFPLTTPIYPSSTSFPHMYNLELSQAWWESAYHVPDKNESDTNIPCLYQHNQRVCHSEWNPWNSWCKSTIHAAARKTHWSLHFHNIPLFSMQYSRGQSHLKAQKHATSCQNNIITTLHLQSAVALAFERMLQKHLYRQVHQTIQRNKMLFANNAHFPFTILAYLLW